MAALDFDITMKQCICTLIILTLTACGNVYTARSFDPVRAHYSSSIVDVLVVSGFEPIFHHNTETKIPLENRREIYIRVTPRQDISIDISGISLTSSSGYKYSPTSIAKIKDITARGITLKEYDLNEKNVDTLTTVSSYKVIFDSSHFEIGDLMNLIIPAISIGGGTHEVFKVTLGETQSKVTTP